MENSQNTQEICAIFIHCGPSHPKYCLGIFLDYNFSLDILSGKLTKFAGHFRNLPVLSDRPTVFAKTAYTADGPVLGVDVCWFCQSVANCIEHSVYNTYKKKNTP